MTVLLEFRERIKLIYSKYEAFILPLAKFLLAFVTLNTMNGRMGYMTRIDDVRMTLIAALTCSFLPMGVLVMLATLFSLLHMYALSMEVALVGLCLYLVMYLLYFRFSPRDSVVVVATPLLCSLGMPYVVPVAVGLLCSPVSVVSVGCGLTVFYFLRVVVDSAQNINTMGDREMLEKIRMLVEAVVGNKAMVVMIVAFAVTVLVVYQIHRMPIEYSWTIAMVAGAMLNVVILLVGDLLYNTNISVVGALFGSLLAVVVGKAIEFFRFCVDYGRTEKVQFEDDEYYYYVKAVPKMTVSVPTRTVKRITSQRGRPSSAGARGSAVRSSAESRSSTVRSSAESRGSARLSAESAERRVTMERTGGRNAARPAASYQARRNGERSVTIGRAYEEETDRQDDEEWQ